MNALTPLSVAAVVAMLAAPADAGTPQMKSGGGAGAGQELHLPPPRPPPPPPKPLVLPNPLVLPGVSVPRGTDERPLPPARAPGATIIYQY